MFIVLIRIGGDRGVDGCVDGDGGGGGDRGIDGGVDGDGGGGGCVDGDGDVDGDGAVDCNGRICNLGLGRLLGPIVSPLFC